MVRNSVLNKQLIPKGNRPSAPDKVFETEVSLNKKTDRPISFMISTVMYGNLVIRPSFLPSQQSHASTMPA